MVIILTHISLYEEGNDSDYLYSDEESLDFEPDSESEDEDINYKFDLSEGNWKRVFENSDVKRERFPFRKKPGLNIDPNLSPVDYFNYFLDDELIEIITSNTNLYAKQCIKKKSDKYWYPETSKEIRLYIILKVLMGIGPKTALHLYWTNKENLEQPVYTRTMKYKRFVKIRQYLHFTDNL